MGPCLIQRFSTSATGVHSVHPYEKNRKISKIQVMNTTIRLSEILILALKIGLMLLI